MAEKMSGLSREFIIHPGETLKEMLTDRGMSQRELALRTDVTEKHISNVVNCLKPISVSFAKKLEYAMGVDAGFWINLQGNYDKEMADFEEVNSISREELEIKKKLKNVISYMQETGFLCREAQGPMLVIQLRKLLNVSSLERIRELTQSGAYRLAVAVNVDPYVLFTWLRMCDLITQSRQLGSEFDTDKLKKKLPLIKSLMSEDINGIRSGLETHFSECGIKFSIIKHFRGAPVQGVIKKNNDRTLSLFMTTRRKFADEFWFTLFHEIGHILNEDIGDSLIDFEFAANDAENRANEFAVNVLIDSEKYERLVESGDYSLHSIKQFCEEQNIPPFILIGRLQKDRLLRYHEYSTEKVRYEFESWIQ